MLIYIYLGTTNERTGYVCTDLRYFPNPATSGCQKGSGPLSIGHGITTVYSRSPARYRKGTFNSIALSCLPKLTVSQHIQAFYANGDMWHGHENGYMNGSGRYHFADGNSFEGEFYSDGRPAPSSISADATVSSAPNR